MWIAKLLLQHQSSERLDGAAGRVPGDFSINLIFRLKTVVEQLAELGIGVDTLLGGLPLTHPGLSP